MSEETTPKKTRKPAMPDRETLLFLERLTSDKHEMGRWKGRLKTLEAMQNLPLAAN